METNKVRSIKVKRQKKKLKDERGGNGGVKRTRRIIKQYAGQHSEESHLSDCLVELSL